MGAGAAVRVGYAADVAARGYAVAPGVLTRSEADQLAGELAKSDLPRSRAGARHVLSHPAVADVARHPRMLEIAQDVLGLNAFPFRATLFDKSRTANWLVVWHQDTALPLTQRGEAAGWGPWSVKDGVHYAHAPREALERVLALRLHLDDSTSENGPLRVMPGTHGLGVLTDEELHELSTKREAVDCLLPTGGVLAMRPLLVHASSKSVSPQPRRVLHVEYGDSALLAAPLQLKQT